MLLWQNMISCPRARKYIAWKICTSAQKTDISYAVNLIMVRLWKDYSSWYSGLCLFGAAKGKISTDNWTGVFVGAAPDKDAPYERHTSLRLTAQPSIHILPHLCQHTPHPPHTHTHEGSSSGPTEIEDLMTQRHSHVHWGCWMMARDNWQASVSQYCQVGNGWDFP